MTDPDASYAVRVVRIAHSRVRMARRDRIATDDLLLALVEESPSEVRNYFGRCAVTPDLIRHEIRRVDRPPRDQVRGLALRGLIHWPPSWAVPRPSRELVAGDTLGFTPLAIEVINVAYARAQGLEHDSLGATHLLLAILGQPECVAARSLSAAFGGTSSLSRFLEQLLVPKPVSLKAAPVAVSELAEELAHHVIDQKPALQEIAAAVALNAAAVGASHRQKLNLLLSGPTGVGKTFAIEKLAQKLHVKIGILSTAAATAPGYIGGDIEQGLWDLFEKSDRDVELTERGIVFLDEFDKLAVRKNGVEREGKMAVGVQQALLRMLEGDKVTLRIAPGESVTLRTDRILFIGGGAFDGLDEVCRQRRRRQGTSWLEATRVEEEDLIDYGFLPELIGRFGYFVEFAALDKTSLLKILKGGDDSPLALYRSYFAQHEVALEITGASGTPEAPAPHATEPETTPRKALLRLEHEVLEHLAEIAARRRLGARPLRALLYRLLLEDVLRPPKVGEPPRVIDLTAAKQRLQLRVSRLNGQPPSSPGPVVEAEP